MGERLGIVLPEIYDGVSVWQEPDGTYTNRWAMAIAKWPDEPVYRRRYDRAQAWIDAQAVTDDR